MASGYMLDETMGFVTCKPLHMYDPKYGMAMRKKGFLVKCCKGVIPNFTLDYQKKDIHACIMNIFIKVYQGYTKIIYFIYP
jgi:hypothetical protein